MKKWNSKKYGNTDGKSMKIFHIYDIVGVSQNTPTLLLLFLITLRHFLVVIAFMYMDFIELCVYIVIFIYLMKYNIFKFLLSLF